MTEPTPHLWAPRPTRDWPTWYWWTPCCERCGVVFTPEIVDAECAPTRDEVEELAADWIAWRATEDDRVGAAHSCPVWPRCHAEMIDLTDLVRCECEDRRYPPHWSDWDAYRWEKARSKARWAEILRRGEAAE